MARPVVGTGLGVVVLGWALRFSDLDVHAPEVAGEEIIDAAGMGY